MIPIILFYRRTDWLTKLPWFTLVKDKKTNSSAFEEFVAGLGWEVELESHTGKTRGISTLGEVRNVEI